MARTHGRLMASIWSDADFIAMRGSAQRMFMFLLSQPDLSHAGLIPMRVNRWAKKAEDLSAAGIRGEMTYLEDRDFIVVDDDTEEVLIRTFVRNDGVYKQPLVMERMREDAKQIESPMLRWAFSCELDRLPLHELSSEPGKGDSPSVRERVERVIRTLRDDFADANRPSREAIERVSDTPHAGAHAAPNHLPPTPNHLPPADRELFDESNDTIQPDRFDEFWDTYGNKQGRAKSVTAYRRALKKPGVTADVLINAAAAYALWCQQTDTFQKNPLTWLHGEHWADELTVRRPVEHQGRASQWLQLAADMPEPEPQNIRQIGPRR